jgi:hypothetical protein
VFVVQLGAGVACAGSASVEGVVMSNVEAMEKTLAALEIAGRIDEVDAARVQALRSMAEALDAKPFNSQMWREYRESLEGLTASGADDGAIEALLAELSAPVGDPKASRAGNVRASARKDR